MASVISPTDGVLRSLGNYPVPPVQTTNANPWATALADVNGDGFQDLIVATSQTNQLVIYLGQKDGGFGLNPSLRLSLGGKLAGTDAKSIVVADFNGDGLPDVAIANANARSGNNNASQGISVFINTTQFGTLSFAGVANYAAGNGPVGLVAADFDGDGNLDLATADSIADSGGSFNVSVLLGDGAGNFSAPAAIKVGDQNTVLKNPTDLAGGLINTDGLPDLAVSGTDVVTGRAAAVILLNTSSPGTPSFSRTEKVVPSTSSASVFTSIDVGVLQTTNNSNATADIVATTSADTLAVMKNTGTGTFGSPVETALAPSGITKPTGVTIQDLDSDNLNDVLLVDDSSPGGLAVLHNVGGGGTISLDTPVVYKVGANAKSLALGDVQNDGKSTEQDVSLIYGSGTFDLSQSPAGIFMPAILTPNIDAPGEMAVGDFNNDGFPDVVVTNPNSSTVSVLLSTGPGTFAAPVTYSTVFNDPVFGLVGQDPVSVAAGDLTGTGKVDIVVASGFSPDGITGFVTILANDGTGNFGSGPVNDVTVDATPTKVALGDFDEDGLLISRTPRLKRFQLVQEIQRHVCGIHLHVA